MRATRLKKKAKNFRKKPKKNAWGKKKKLINVCTGLKYKRKTHMMIFQEFYAFYHPRCYSTSPVA